MYSKWNRCPRVLEVNRLQGLEEWRKNNYMTVGSPFLHEYDVPSHPNQLEHQYTQQELESIRRSDYYLCGSDFIGNYLKKTLKINNWILHSMGLPIGDFLEEVGELEFRDFKHRKNFLFLGNLLS